ncbi:MAG: aminotransferase class V-fold PLP-dependent enzyme [Planctomycetota bacterium]|nr:aminotransferase class V-fold PLP-dependent enzyme [Planctomycetota bacterium]
MIYFDNAATSYPKPPEVFEAMTKFMLEHGGNPGRSGHRLATSAEAMIVEARNAVSKFFGLKDPSRCVFTMNCTDGLNIVIKGVLKPGDHAITSVLEHNSINRPLQKAADDGTIALTRVGMNPKGAWNVEDVLAAVTPKTRLVALTHCSNVLGVVCPVEELAFKLREKHPHVRLLVDAAQTAGLVPLDMDLAGIDFLAFPGHKALFAPTGTGALLIHPRIDAKELHAWREGGTGGDSASPHQPVEFPHFLEGGTPNTMGIAGMLAGIRFLQREGGGLGRERLILNRLIEGLRGDERFKIYGSPVAGDRSGVLSFTIKDRDNAEVATILDQAFEICVRPGLHCAPYTHQALGTFPTGTIRLSPGYFNTEAEADRVLEALKEIAS